MPVVKVVNNNMELALRECKKLFSDIKRTKSRYVYFLRPALKLREKKKMAIMKRKFY